MPDPTFTTNPSSSSYPPPTSSSIPPLPKAMTTSTMPDLARKTTRFSHTPARPCRRSFFSLPTKRQAVRFLRNAIVPPSMPSDSSDILPDEMDTAASVNLERKTSLYGNSPDEDKDFGPVSHVVVESNLGLSAPEGSKSEDESGVSPNDGDGDTGRKMSGQTLDIERGPNEENGTYTAGGGGSQHGWKKDEESRLHRLFIGRIWAAWAHFFNPRFQDPAAEADFQEEAWYGFRQGALLFSTFFTLAWILSAALSSHPIPYFNKIAFITVNGILNGLLPFIVAFDFPRRYPIFYKTWLLASSFEFAISVLINMRMCNYYTTGSVCVNGQGFIMLFYWSTAIPTMAVLGLGQSRLFHLAGVLIWSILLLVLVLIQPGAPSLMWRNLVLYLGYNFFLLTASYLREIRDRKLYSLRAQFKQQFKATQSAQVAERRATIAHKRFAAYIYHEVRVPLNTALLAVQNLEAECVFRGLEGEQRDMVEGLKGSLDIMAKVLSDSLSFNRMESGKLTLARKPFEFRKAIDLVLLSHRTQAESMGLQLLAEMDPEIEKIGGGVFIGDPLRLTQVVGNLVSNACKFTPTGEVKIVTKLVYPRSAALVAEVLPTPDPTPSKESMEEADMFPMHTLPKVTEPSSALAQDPVAMQQQAHYSQYLPVHPTSSSKAIIRVEVHDTGVGLRPSDVADNKLFSPYVQTEIGRRQGGKGSGLGLALCQQIVSLCQGRMGVESQVGKGSCFWFEIAYSLPPETRNPFDLRVMDGLLHTPNHTRNSPGPSPRMSFSRDRTRTGGAESPVAPSVRRGSGMAPRSSAEMRRPPAGDPLGIVGGMMVDMRVSLEERRNSLVVEPKRAEVSSTRPLQALVVDDDKLTRMLMSRMLRRLGHEVTTAENGAVAMDLLRDRHGQERQFDVLFLDNQMPVMSGVEVARELREMGSEVFVVGCTGNALKEDQEEYLEAGADQVLTKPVKEVDVREALREASEGR